MRNLLFIVLFSFYSINVDAQVTYIGITNHNTGTGSNNLFNNYVAVGQTCYIDWEVYSEGMTNMEPCGFRSVSRLILRRTGDNDTTSVVASAPVIVPGICGGKNGNNDHYYAELSSYIDKPGRYSVEVQADLPNMTYPFENASTRTTFNYSCPSAYYLTGTGGPTGNYYTPSGSCAGGPGLSDPVGGQGADALTEIFTSLKFFTVGEVGTYRSMVVLNGNFYDLPKGKFQPGNPSLPVSLNGTNGIPAYGVCPLTPAPQISVGGEVNTFKRTDCSADITGASLFYRLYKSGTPIANVFNEVSLGFKDDCSFSPNGPEGNIFPTGGSCQNANNILDQRWQTINGVANIIPVPSFALQDTGIWMIEFFMKTFSKNCTGTADTLLSDTSTTSFTVNNPEAPGSPCGNVIPVILSSFTASAAANGNILRWTIENTVPLSQFNVQRSFDGYRFDNIGTVVFANGKYVYQFTDAGVPAKTAFYRIILKEKDGNNSYSSIVRVNSNNRLVAMQVISSGQNMELRVQNFVKGKYQLAVMNTSGSLIIQQQFFIADAGSGNLGIQQKVQLAHGVYYAVMRDDTGNVIARTVFTH